MEKFTVEAVNNALDKFAPCATALEYDNVGLMFGSLKAEVSGVMLCLDVTLEVLKEALEGGCNLVVSHHPLIFKKLGEIDVDEEKGEIIEFAIKNGISVLSYHTNLDMVEGGLNTRLSYALGATFSETIAEGALFELEKEITLAEFFKRVKTVLGDNSLRAAGDKNKTIKKVFVISGAGGRDENAYNFAKQHADVFLTGEVRHNLFLSAVRDNFAIVEFSHYYSEICCLDVLFDVIKCEFGDIKLVKSKQQSPFWTSEEL